LLLLYLAISDVQRLSLVVLFDCYEPSSRSCAPTIAAKGEDAPSTLKVCFGGSSETG